MDHRMLLATTYAHRLRLLPERAPDLGFRPSPPADRADALDATASRVVVAGHLAAVAGAR